MAEQDGRSSSSSAGRQEWMLAPPPAASVAEMLRADPRAALKARGFTQGGSSGQRVQRTSYGSGEGSAGLWTESPAERQRRLQDEELGIRSKATEDDVGGGALNEVEQRQREADRARDERIRAAVQEHTATRGPSLLEQHQAKRRTELRERERGKGKERSRREHEESTSGSEAEDRARRRRREKEERRKHRRDRSASPSSSSSHKHRRRSSHRDPSEDEHDRERRRRHRKEREDEKEDRRRHRHRHSSPSSSSRRRADREREREEDEEEERRRRKKKEKRRKEEEERGEKRGAPMMVWDREAAMSVGGRLMDERKRMDMIKSASSLSDRFGQGTSRYM